MYIKKKFDKYLKHWFSKIDKILTRKHKWNLYK